MSAGTEIMSRGPATGEPDNTPAATGWGSAAGIAVLVVLADPRLWLIGSAAFLLRGGWLLLGLPIWALPSPVGISTLLGPNAFTAAGPSAGLVAALLAATGALAILIALSAVGAAWIEVAAYVGFCLDPETDGLRTGRVARPPTGRRRARLILEVVGIQATMLLPAAVAFVASVAAMATTLRAELEFPSGYDMPLLARVAIANAGILALAGVLLVIGDAAAAVVTRRLLAIRCGLGGSARAGLTVARDAFRERPAAVLLTGLAAWLATILAVLPPLAAVLLAWGGVRSFFLAPPVQPGFAPAAGWALATLLFVSTWCAAIVLAGLASAYRAALWSATTLH
jgi:hypothetical protein